MNATSMLSHTTVTIIEVRANVGIKVDSSGLFNVILLHPTSITEKTPNDKHNVAIDEKNNNRR